MVAPTWCHGANRGQPCLGRMWTDVTSEFTHFNLVIRLSNVKQLAIPFTTILRFLAARAVLVNPWNPDLGTLTFAQVKPCLPNYHKPPFCRCPSCLQCNMSKRQQACPLPAGLVFLVSGEVKHLVHLIHLNLNGRLMPMWCDRLPSLRGSDARLSRIERGPITKCCCFSFLFTN